VEIGGSGFEDSSGINKKTLNLERRPAWWCILVLPVTWGGRKIMVILETFPEKQTQTNKQKDWGVVEVLEHLPNKYEALSSISRTAHPTPKI
jgi:hypothetical protein